MESSLHNSYALQRSYEIKSKTLNDIKTQARLNAILRRKGIKSDCQDHAEYQRALDMLFGRPIRAWADNYAQLVQWVWDYIF